MKNLQSVMIELMTTDNRSGLPPIIREEWVDNNNNNSSIMYSIIRYMSNSKNYVAL